MLPESLLTCLTSKETDKLLEISQKNIPFKRGDEQTKKLLELGLAEAKEKLVQITTLGQKVIKAEHI